LTLNANRSVAEHPKGSVSKACRVLTYFSKARARAAKVPRTLDYIAVFGLLLYKKATVKINEKRERRGIGQLCDQRLSGAEDKIADLPNDRGFQRAQFIKLAASSN
jgi:hypothetical protein